MYLCVWLCFRKELFDDEELYIFVYYESLRLTGKVCATGMARPVFYILAAIYFQAFGLTPQQMQQIGNNSSGKQHRRNISSPEQVVQSIREEAEKREWRTDLQSLVALFTPPVQRVTNGDHSFPIYRRL